MHGKSKLDLDAGTVYAESREEGRFAVKNRDGEPWIYELDVHGHIYPIRHASSDDLAYASNHLHVLGHPNWSGATVDEIPAGMVCYSILAKSKQEG